MSGTAQGLMARWSVFYSPPSMTSGNPTFPADPQIWLSAEDAIREIVEREKANLHRQKEALALKGFGRQLLIERLEKAAVDYTGELAQSARTEVEAYRELGRSEESERDRIAAEELAWENPSTALIVSRILGIPVKPEAKEVCLGGVHLGCGGDRDADSGGH